MPEPCSQWCPFLACDGCAWKSGALAAVVPVDKGGWSVGGVWEDGSGPRSSLRKQCRYSEGLAPSDSTGKD